MANYIPGSETMDEGMEKAAMCASHGKVSKKEAIKYKSLAKRKKKESTKTAGISHSSAFNTLTWMDNGLRDALQEVNDAMERLSLEKGAALADVGRIGAAYLRDGATLYDVVSLLGEREITKTATVSVLDHAEKLGGGIEWEAGEGTDGIEDPYGLADTMDQFVESCWYEENLSKVASAIIDARLELADELSSIEKTAKGAWAAKHGGRAWKGLVDMLFGSAKGSRVQPGAKGWEAFKQARQKPHVPLFRTKKEARKTVSKEEYDRVKKVYGKKYTEKMTSKTDPTDIEYKAVAPRFGGVLGSMRKYPLPWIAGGLMAPTAYRGLKGKLAENKARATAGLGTYQPPRYGTY
jgi:hypothetical protein